MLQEGGEKAVAFRDRTFDGSPSFLQIGLDLSPFVNAASKHRHFGFISEEQRKEKKGLILLGWKQSEERITSLSQETVNCDRNAY